MQKFRNNQIKSYIRKILRLIKKYSRMMMIKKGVWRINCLFRAKKSIDLRTNKLHRAIRLNPMFCHFNQQCICIRKEISMYSGSVFSCNRKQISSQFIRIQEANRSINKMLLISMSQEAYRHALCGFRTIKRAVLLCLSQLRNNMVSFTRCTIQFVHIKIDDLIHASEADSQSARGRGPWAVFFTLLFHWQEGTHVWVVGFLLCHDSFVIAVSFWSFFLTSC